MKGAFLILLTIHGLIHLIGHYNAYNPGKIDGMTLPVSRPYGFLWLATAVLLVISAILLMLNLYWWWILGSVALGLSQFLVIRFWHDARFGTVGNVILLFGLIVGLGNWLFYQEYRDDYLNGIDRSEKIVEEVLTEKDLKHLPAAVKRYLNYTGVVGKPKVYNFRTRMRAQLRNEGEDWFRLRSEQYNFVDEYERLFFLRAVVKGMPVRGYHKYMKSEARMLIKALSWFPLIDESGEQLFEAETVTLFNDMCVMAPATLISENIVWEEVDVNIVRATITNGTTSISAILVFNELGQLVNFISDDRYDIKRKKKIRFSTPISDYKERNGYQLATYGEAIWHYPEGDFTYGKFKIRNVRYNVSEDSVL